MSDLDTQDDGYTLDGYIKADPGLHEACRFTFRPLLHEQRYTYGEEFQRKTPLQAARLMYDVLSRQVKSWDAKRKGKDLPLTPAGIRLADPNVIDRMYAIVAGRIPSDPDPNKAAEVDESEAELKSLLEGTSIGAERDGAAVKN